MAASAAVGGLSVDELLERIGSRAVSPGAGAAGAVALALAAACACKAVNLTLKHRPDDLELQSALEAIQRVQAAALVEADRDAEAFEALVHDKDRVAVERLVSEEERLGRLIDALATALDDVAPRVRVNMTGDIAAARALAAAAQRIKTRNEEETLRMR